MTHTAPEFDLDNDDGDQDQATTTVTIKEYEADKAKLTVHHQSSFGRLIEMDEGLAVDCRQVKDRSFRNLIVNAIQQTLGNGTASEYATGFFPVTFLAKHMVTLSAHVEKHDGFDLSKDKRFAPFWVAVAREHSNYVEAFNKRVADGVLEYSDLEMFFTKGEHVVDVSGEFPIGGVVVSTSYVRTMMSSYFAIRVNVVQAFSGALRLSTTNMRIDAFGKLKPISELSTVKITDDFKAELTERGRVFQAVTSGASYVRYTGDISRAGWWGSRNSFRADGRVMVDPVSFARIDHDGHNMENREFSSNPYGHQPDKQVAFDLTEKDLWRTYPYVLGFSFRAKQWGRMDVAGITPIKWRDDAFDYLVMEDSKKRMVKALVENAKGSFSDIVDEKGGGTIFMLAGRPGLGKTLLAETVAEISHKPLYSVSVGELGTEPTQLEERLRMILDVATIWDAVLLIDEADIFLEARDTKDIVRNAMVGVFLRLLEYHQGVLFLTTNRVKNIDSAFFSRISVPLNFEDATSAKRGQIWRNLLQAAKISDIVDDKAMETLAGLNVNGRQVKNAIRIAMTLAKAEGRTVTLADLLAPVSMADEFHKNLVTG